MRESSDDAIRRIEWVFRREKAIRQAVYEKRMDRGGFTGGDGNGHCRISDPTALQAIRNVIELETIIIDDGGRIMYPEKWLRVIDKMREWCKEDTINAEIFRRRYEDEEAYYRTSMELHITGALYYQRLLKIRNQAKIFAAYEQLI